MPGTRRRASSAARDPPTTDDDVVAEVADVADDAAIDAVCDRYLRFGADPAEPYIVSFFPAASKPLWLEWDGTLLQQAPRRLLAGVLAVGLYAVYLPQEHAYRATFEAHTAQFDSAWGYVFSLATLAITLLLSQSYAYWSQMKSYGRKLQGRLNDLCMLLSTHAARDGGGQYTAEAEEMLDEVARHCRLLQILFYAHLLKPGKGQAARGHISVFATPPGLAALVRRRALTPSELETLRCLELQPSAWASAVLQWVVARFVEARRAGLTLVGVGGDAGMEGMFLEKALELRSVTASMPDELDSRMPLVYVHTATLLADLVLLSAPLALGAKLGAPLATLVSLLLAVFYGGLVRLAKAYLDPFGAAGRTAQTLVVDLLVGESNAGSVRWVRGAKRLPFATQPVSASARKGANRSERAGLAAGGLACT